MLYPIARLVISALLLLFVVFAPPLQPGMGEAICLVVLTNLRLLHWKAPQTRMDFVREALWQALYLALFLCFLRLPEIEQISDLMLPFAVAVGALAVMLVYGLSRILPMGAPIPLKNAASVVLASVGIALAAHFFWAEGSPPLAAISGLIFTLLITTPAAIHLEAAIAARSRAEFTVTEVTNRLIVGLSLCLVVFGTRPDFWIGLVSIVPVMLAISSIRIWRWQASPAPTADETA